jgi:hypothetical protein
MHFFVVFSMTIADPVAFQTADRKLLVPERLRRCRQFYPASPKDAKGAAILAGRLQRFGVSGHCGFVGQALIQQLAVEAVQGWLQTVRDAEVVVNLRR